MCPCRAAGTRRRCSRQAAAAAPAPCPRQLRTCGSRRSPRLCKLLLRKGLAAAGSAGLALAAGGSAEGGAATQLCMGRSRCLIGGCSGLARHCLPACCSLPRSPCRLGLLGFGRIGRFHDRPVAGDGAWRRAAGGFAAAAAGQRGGQQQGRQWRKRGAASIMRARSLDAVGWFHPAQCCRIRMRRQAPNRLAGTS